MRILQLCNKPPLPKVDGGCIAIHNISAGLLSRNEELHILTVSTEKHPFLKEAYPADFLERTKIEGVFVDTRVNVIDAFSALVTADSYNISRFFSSDFDKLLVKRLTEYEYDIVHLESLFMTPYMDTIRRHSTARIVLRSHNLEHLIWERLANSTGNQAKKLYLKHLASKLKAYEKKTINEVDGIAAISFEDTNRFIQLKCKVPLITIPFGIDLDKYPYTPPEKKALSSLFHLGAMNWLPNLEGINWLLDDMWPDISRLPVTLHLAGRDMPASIQRQASEKLQVHGEVESAVNFMNSNEIMIVPLLSGSGMRVKIIEGMALGKVVITTTVGAEGIDYVKDTHLLIADTPKEFYAHIHRLNTDPEFGYHISVQARKLVEEKYDNQLIIRQLCDFYGTILAKKGYQLF